MAKVVSDSKHDNSMDKAYISIDMNSIHASSNDLYIDLNKNPDLTVGYVSCFLFSLSIPIQHLFR